MDIIPVSQRGSRVPASPMRLHHPLAQAAGQRGMMVHYLNIGQPDLPTPEIFFDRLHTLRDPVVRYAPSAGFPEVQRAWQRYYQDSGLAVEADEVIVTAGGSEALQFALIATTDPGDEVMIFEPTYPSYLSFAALLGIGVVPVQLDAERGFHLPDRKIIEAAITPQTRAIIICNPSNPAGTLFTSDEVHQIAEVAREHGLYVIADEVYREFNYTDAPHHSLLRETAIHQQLLLVDSVSKRFNLCGARVGAVITKNEVVRDVLLKCAQSRLSVPTLEQLAIVPLLEDSQRYLASVLEHYQERRTAISQAFASQSLIQWYQPEGAFYLMVTLPVDDTNHFIQWMLTSFSDQNETVFIAPGSGFYVQPAMGQHQARIAYVLDAPQLTRSIELISLALTNYLSKQPV